MTHFASKMEIDLSISYDIGIQRWIFPWLSRYSAIDHFWSDDEKRLTLVRPNGDSLSFGNMDKRTLKVYANIREFKESQKPVLPPTTTVVAPPAPEAVPIPDLSMGPPEPLKPTEGTP